jgi:hypothetical protein
MAAETTTVTIRSGGVYTATKEQVDAKTDQTEGSLVEGPTIEALGQTEVEEE